MKAREHVLGTLGLFLSLSLSFGLHELIVGKDMSLLRTRGRKPRTVVFNTLYLDDSAVGSK